VGRTQNFLMLKLAVLNVSLRALKGYILRERLIVYGEYLHLQ
jgi:hypothetical protein